MIKTRTHRNDYKRLSKSHNSQETELNQYFKDEEAKTKMS